jgi:hypothetical protein
MPYISLDTTKPTTAQARQAAIDSERTNLQAIRDSLITTGIVQGFNYSAAGGTVDQPAQVFYKRGAEWVRVNLTWGTVGGDAGNVTKAAFYYSANSGGAYDSMGDLAGNYVASITYDANSNATAITWGATP